jgi:hypothetical protein
MVTVYGPVNKRPIQLLVDVEEMGSEYKATHLILIGRSIDRNVRSALVQARI